jgi:hypothetical protein
MDLSPSENVLPLRLALITGLMSIVLISATTLNIELSGIASLQNILGNLSLTLNGAGLYVVKVETPLIWILPKAENRLLMTLLSYVLMILAKK